MKPRLRGPLPVIFSVLVSVGLIAWLITRIDSARTLQLLRQAQGGWIVAAVCLALLIPLCGTCRWLGVLQAHEPLQFPFRAAWRATMSSSALNLFLPSKAGDLAKAFYFRKQGGLSLGLGAVVLERLSDLLTLGVLGITGGLLSMNLLGMTVGAILSLGSGLAFILILFHREMKLPVPAAWQTGPDEWARLFRRWLQRPGSMVMTLGGSLANWALAGLIVCTLATAFTGPSDWGKLLALFPLAVLAGLVPITVGGLGTRDAAFVTLLTGQLTTEGATLVAFGYTILAYGLIGLLGIPVALREIMPLVCRRRW